MKLFDMNDYDIQQAVDSHDDYLFDLFYEAEEPQRNCENCRFYYDGICGILEDECSQAELEVMSDEEYKERFGKEPDDYCDEHEFWED